MIGPDVEPKLAVHEPRRGEPHFGEAEAWTVARLAGLDRGDAGGCGVRSGGKWAVADLQFDDVLTRALQLPRDRQNREGPLGLEFARQLCQSRHDELLEGYREAMAKASGRTTRGTMNF